MAQMSLFPNAAGINLNITGYANAGGRKYMEDYFSVAYKLTEHKKDLEYAYFGIFDGHGGQEAALFAKDHLLSSIVTQKSFWSYDDSEVLNSIRKGYIATHLAMWKQLDKWPRTTSGFPSTAGTTATVAFIRRGKIYVGHVGDSGIAMGFQRPGDKSWKVHSLTQDHKPESTFEKSRILNAGGKVITKSGVPRVVWNRPHKGHKGPITRSTPFDEIPFLAVARSLGDLWSYNSSLNQFVVSPDPDVKVIKFDPKTFRCLIFGTDGLWNVIGAHESVALVQDVCREKSVYTNWNTECQNPSKYLVDKAIEKWNSRKMRADNTSVIICLLEPSGSSNTLCNKSHNLISYSTTEHNIMEKSLNYLNPYNIPSTSGRMDELFSSYENMTVNIVTDLYHPQYFPTVDIHEKYNIPNYTVAQKYENASSHHQSYYGDTRISDDFMLDNSSSNYVFESCPNSVSNYVTAPAHSSEIFLEPSFAESYNSFLSNTENDNSSNSDSDSYRHIYKSLNETGLAGQDLVYQHLPNRFNEQQQHQYQQACMLDEGGYSLTKLETRCEQKMRNSYDSISNHDKKDQDFNRTFHSVAESTNLNNFNCLSNGNKTKSLQATTEQPIENNRKKVFKEFEKSGSILSTSKNDNKRKIVEPIQISEISSSNVIEPTTHEEIVSSSSSSSSNNISNDEIMSRKRKSLDISYNQLDKKAKSSFPDRQNENISTSSTNSESFSNNKRNLRLRNSLPSSKEIKSRIGSIKKAPTTLKRTMIAKEFLKNLNSCKYRTRHQQHQANSLATSNEIIPDKSNKIQNSRNLALTSNITNLNVSCCSSKPSSTKNNKIHSTKIVSVSPPTTRSAALSAKRLSSCLVGKT